MLYLLKSLIGNKDTKIDLKFMLGGVHKLRLQDLAFFYHLPPSLYIKRYKSLQKVDFFDHLPPLLL